MAAVVVDVVDDKVPQALGLVKWRAAAAWRKRVQD